MKRALIITAIVIGVFAVVGGLAFAFGTPQAPDVAAYTAAPGEVVPSPYGEQAAEPVAPDVAAGEGIGAGGQRVEVPAADPSVPLAIEIPGCVCHSDDPKIVEAHSKYRMNQCAGCHAGETPTGM